VSALLRLVACAALLSGVYTAVSYLRPALMHECGLEFWELPAWQLRIDAQYDRQRELDRRWQISAARDHEKTQICRELIAGRITLREAARRFAELPDPPERFWEDLRKNFPQGTDPERLCRHVITWACDLPERADQTDALRRRLEKELRSMSGNELRSLFERGT
jgi:hypothetical protein